MKIKRKNKHIDVLLSKKNLNAVFDSLNDLTAEDVIHGSLMEIITRDIIIKKNGVCVSVDFEIWLLEHNGIISGCKSCTPLFFGWEETFLNKITFDCDKQQLQELEQQLMQHVDQLIKQHNGKDY